MSSDDGFDGDELNSGDGSSDQGDDFQSILQSWEPPPKKEPKPEPAPWWKFWSSGKKKKAKKKDAWFINPFTLSKTARTDKEIYGDPVVDSDDENYPYDDR